MSLSYGDVFRLKMSSGMLECLDLFALIYLSESKMTENAEFTQLAPNMYVAGQLELSDVERLGTLGINTLVCNRPDGEADQTSSNIIAAAAKAAGINFVYLPMASPEDTLSQKQEFKKVLAEGGVVLAYCRTGRRSSTLWQESIKE